jgi:hypothetical protein
MPLDSKKLIAYIDQNIISNIVKAKEGRIDRPDLVALFEVLNAGMRSEKLVCPRSWFHREEGSLTSLDADIQRYLRYISQLDFEPPFEIEKRQFFNAACTFLGKEPYYTGWKLCLESDPDERLTRYALDASMPMDIFNFRETRVQYAADMNTLRESLRGCSYAEHLATERKGVASYLHTCYGWGVAHLFGDVENGAERYRDFLATDLVSTVISMDLFAQFCASLLIRYNQREVQTGDITDMKILSNLLPYCHVVTTDKFMKELTRLLKFGERFGVKIFSGQADDIDALTEHLKQLMAERAPADIPALGRLIVPDEQMKEHLWEFFRAMHFAVRAASVWVEVVNVNDGGCPIYAHARSGLRMPDPSFFFEFDREIKSAGRSVDEITGSLRADDVVVIDSYHRHLPRDLTRELFAAVTSGVETVPKYGWRIIRKQTSVST